MVCHIQIYLGGTDEQLGYMVTGIFDKYSADVVWQYCVICAGLLFVKVKSGYHRDTDSIVTDFIIIDRATSREEHLHLGIDEETGEVLFEEWRKNH